MGSTTHSTPLTARALAPSSPRKPSPGRAVVSRSKLSRSAALSTSVTMSVALVLVQDTSTPSRRRRRTRSAPSLATSTASASSSSYPPSALPAAGTSVMLAESRSLHPEVRTAAGRAAVPGRRLSSDGGPPRLLAPLDRGPLQEQVADHRDEPRVDARRGRA